MKALLSDWRFILTIVVTLLAATIPYWLEARGADIRAHILSRTPLVPTGQKDVPGLSIVWRNVVLDTPYLSLVRVANEGGKPVLTKDFEGVFAIHIAEPSEVVNASVTARDPANLVVEIEQDTQEFRVKPLLLNPGDSFTVSVLSSKAAPTVDARARIAGVSKIVVVNDLQETPPSTSSPGKRWLQVIASMVLLTLTGAIIVSTYAYTSPEPSVLLMKKGPMLLVGMIGLVAAELGLAKETADLGFAFWGSTAFLLVCLVASIAFARYIAPKPLPIRLIKPEAFKTGSAPPTTSPET